MSNDVAIPSGNGGDDGGGRHITGSMLKFNGADLSAPWKRSDAAPLADRYLAVQFVHLYQKWQNGRVVEEIGAHPLPDLDDLNAATDKNTWEEGMNGPRPPWQNGFFVTLVERASMDVITFVSGTVGGAQAYGDLKRAVEIKHRVDGPSWIPVVSLAVRTMPTRFGPRPAPRLAIVDWVQPSGGGSGLPIEQKPTPQIEHQPGPPKSETKPEVRTGVLYRGYDCPGERTAKGFRVTVPALGIVVDAENEEAAREVVRAKVNASITAGAKAPPLDQQQRQPKVKRAKKSTKAETEDELDDAIPF
jgi:hypothetical protein